MTPSLDPVRLGCEPSALSLGRLPLKHVKGVDVDHPGLLVGGLARFSAYDVLVAV